MKIAILSLMLAVSGALFSQSASAQSCTYQLNKNELKLNWTAFKTPSKVGVNGSFTELGLEKDLYASKTFSALMEGINFSIATSTVATKNSQRDQKIAKFFFKNVKNIKGTVLEASESLMTVGLEMNGVKKELPLNVVIQGDSFSAKGVIDIMDFSMSEHLKSINKACFELHQGKTWSDVSVELTGKLTKSCK